MRATESVGSENAADQAAGLRRLIASRDSCMLALSGAEAASYLPLALDLAAASERDGRRVLLLDLTRGALARQLGRTIRYELMHVIDAHKRLDEVLVPGPREVPLLPAARGVRALANSWRGRPRFAEFVERAGGSPQLVLAVAPAEELEMLTQIAAFATLVVVGPEGGTDLKPSYAALKRAYAARAAAPRLIYAGIEAGAAHRAHARLIEISRAFLGGEPELVGCLLADGTREPREPADQLGFPCLSVDQLARAVVRWQIPAMAAAAASRSAPRIAVRAAANFVSP